MAKIRQVTGSNPPSQHHPFDEELWPVNVALIVLAGFVGGAIIAVSRFDDPRWLYNGWARLTTLAITTGVLIWAASKFPGRRFRRALQLAAVLSLLVHFGAMVVLYNQRMAFLHEQQMAEANVTVFEKPVDLPDYTEPEEPQELQEHEKPVETETPDESMTPVPVERQEAAQQTPVEGQPTPEPGATPEVAPNPIERAELVEAAPRRADEQSLLSRQLSQATPRPDEPIAAPQQPQLSPQQATKVEATASAIARSTTVTPEVAAPGEPTATTPIQRQVTQIARREAPETRPTESSSVPTLNRALNEPRAAPLVEAEAPQPVAVSPSAVSNPLLPNSVAVSRQTTAPNIAQQMAAEPRPSAAPAPTLVEAARQPRNDAPQLASAPPTVAQRPTADAKVPGGEAGAVPQATVVTENVGGSPAPSITQVARGTAEAPGPSPIHAAGSDPGAAPATIAGGSIARAVPSEIPTINPRGAVSGAPGRATVAANAPASPMNVESPSVAIAEEASASAAPTRSVLSRGTAGIAGIGRDVNFDRGESSTPNPGTVPSTSARRAQASQTAPPGPAPSPSMPALVAKSIAGGNIPQGTLAAQDVETATVGGVNNPGNIEASSGAAVVRADASAPAGKITAGVGQGDFDIGPTQIVAKVGNGRPSGGGGPEVRLDKQGPAFSRQPSAGAPLAAIAATAVAEVPQAPAGTGGGGPAGDGGGAGGPAVGGGAIGVTKSAAGGVAAVVGRVGDPVVGGGGAAVASGPLARAGGRQEALPGPVAVGGVAQPGRAVGRVAFAEVKADSPQVSAGPTVGTPSPGAAIEAVGDTTVKSSAGLPGRITAGPVGAVAGDVPTQSTVVGGGPGLGLAKRAGAPTNENAPTVGPVGAPGIQRKLNVAGLPTGQIAGIDAPALPSGGGTGSVPGVAGSPEPAQPGPGTAASRGAGAVPVQVAALEGPGGLGLTGTANVGSMSRQARRDSELVHAGAARFLNRSVGGPLAIDGGAREPAAAFSRRRGRKFDPSGEYGQPLERTDESVELGLDFLARHQSPDGSWSLHKYGAGRPGYEKETSQLRSDTAATGLALLAFLGAGYDHYDDNYAAQIRQGLEFLVKNQKADGNLFIPMDAESNKSVWLYSHGIATIALCEAFGMTGDADLREPAQKAIDFVVNSQNKDRGGWRYVPGRDSDTSVSGWQLMALKSGELAGLKVPKDTYAKVEKWLDSSQSSPNGLTQYSYNPFAPVQTAPGRFADHGRRPTAATTSMGLLMRLYTGWTRGDQRLKAGCDFLLQNPPLHGTAQQPTRDSYYWYYATQLMFHMKGDYWKRWNERLHPALVDQQIRTGPFAGSWDPRLPVPDRWGILGGRMYVTALNLLSLEVYYRHLPIYEQTAK